MENVAFEMHKQKKRFIEIISLLKQTTPETSEEMTPRVVLLTNEITIEGRRLKETYSLNELLPYEEELADMAKQISEMFDYTVRSFKNSLTGMKDELISLQNKKRLNQYNR